MNLQYFNKSPGANKPTPPHQDGYYFMITPCEAVTMWLALDEVDDEEFERLLALAEEEEEFVDIDGDDFDKLGL